MTISKFTAKINADTKKFLAKMKEVQAEAEKLQDEITVKVNANIKDAIADMTKVQQLAQQLEGKDVDIQVDADTLSAVTQLERAKQAVDDLRNNMNNINIKIRANVRQFYRALNRLKAELMKLKEDATVIDIKANITDFMRDILQVRALAQQLETDGVNIDVSLDTAQLTAQIAQVQAQIAQLSTQSPTINLQASNADVIQAMAEIKAVLVTLRDTTIDIKADISNFMVGAAVVQATASKLNNKNIVVKIWTDFTNAMQAYAVVVRAFAEAGQQILGGTVLAIIPTLVPIVSVLIGLIGNMGVMLGVAATSAFALVTALGAAAVAAGAFAAVAIPTIKTLFDENAKLTQQQKAAKQSFDDFKATYDGLVKATEQPVLNAFTSAMNAANKVLQALEPMFISVSEAVAGLMESLNQSIDSQPLQDFFSFLNNDAAGLLTTIGEAVGYLMQGLLNMMTAFAPLAKQTANGFREMAKGFAEWANGLSESDRFKELMQYTQKYMPIMKKAFKDLIVGVVEFFSAFADQSEGFIKGFADMMSAFREWASSLGENKEFQRFLGFIKDSTPAVISLIGNLWEMLVGLGMAMAPVGKVVLDLANSFLEWFSTALQAEGIISKIVGLLPVVVGVISALVPVVIGAVSVIKNLGLAFAGIKTAIASFNLVSFIFQVGGALTALLNPVGLVVAGLALLGGGFALLANHLGKSSVEVTSWKDNVSKATAETLGSFMDLSDKATVALNQMAWGGQAVTQEMATNMVSMYKEMGDQVLAEMQSDHAEQLTSLQSHFANSSALTETEEAAILAKTQEYQAQRAQAVTDGQARISEIYNTALTEKRAITEKEQQEINAIQQTMVDNAIEYMTQNQAEQKAIYESMRAQAAEITALQAAEVVKNAIEQRDKVIEEAQTQYTEAVAEYIKLRDEAGVISAEQADKLIQEATRTKDETVKSAEEMHQKVVDEAKLQAQEHVDHVDWSTGEILSKWDVMKTDVTKKMSEIGESIKKDWTQAYNDAAEWVGKMYDEVSEKMSSTSESIEKDWTKAYEDTTKWLGDMYDKASEKFESMGKTIDEKMSEISGFIENGWGKAVTFLEGIDLAQIGSDIVMGLVNGISDGFGWVKKKVGELAGLIPDWLKGPLKIFSPSRVMASVAQWIPAGVAKGITDNLNVVRTAAKELAGATMPDFSKTIETSKQQIRAAQNAVSNTINASKKEVQKITSEGNKKIADIESKLAKDIQSIQKGAASKKRKLTKAELSDISKLRSTASKEIKEIETKVAEDVAKKQQALNGEKLDNLTSYIDKQKELHGISAAEEAAYWKYASTAFKDGTDDKLRALQKYTDAYNRTMQEQFNNEMYLIEEARKYGAMSRREEILAYEEYIKSYARGSEQQIAYERQIYDEKKALYTDLKAVADSYLTKVQDVYSKLADEEQRLRDEYQQTFESRRDTLANTWGLFDEVNLTEMTTFNDDGSVQKQIDLLDNMRQQVNTLSQWMQDLASLTHKGVEEGLIQELQNLGPKAAAEIAALNRMSGTELQEYERLWKAKMALAGAQATNELAGARADMETEITKLRENATKELDQLKVNMLKEVDEMVNGSVDAFDFLSATLPELGKHAMQGLIDEFKKMSGPLQSVVDGIANDVSKSMEGILMGEKYNAATINTSANITSKATTIPKVQGTAAPETAATPVVVNLHQDFAGGDLVAYVDQQQGIDAKFNVIKR